MPVPVARPVNLLHDERAHLESLIRAHSTPQSLAFRCRLILRASAHLRQAKTCKLRKPLPDIS